jgi:hypothetical protein
MVTKRFAYDRERIPWRLPRKTGRFIVMPLLHVVAVLVVVGVVLWLINQFIPMAGSIKGILNAVVVISVVLWLLRVFGLLPSITKISVGRF